MIRQDYAIFSKISRISYQGGVSVQFHWDIPPLRPFSRPYRGGVYLSGLGDLEGGLFFSVRLRQILENFDVCGLGGPPAAATKTNLIYLFTTVVSSEMLLQQEITTGCDCNHSQYIFRSGTNPWPSQITDVGHFPSRNHGLDSSQAAGRRPDVFEFRISNFPHFPLESHR